MDIIIQFAVYLESAENLLIMFAVALVSNLSLL